MFEKYYALLSLPINASDEEVKKAYKKLAIKYHPDKQNGCSDEEKKEAESKFKEIAEAYEILTNKEKYSQQNMFNSNNGFVNPHDIFNQIFREMNINSNFNVGSRFGSNISINIPHNQANVVMRSSSVVIQNNKRIETIKETTNGVTRQRVIVSDLNSSLPPNIQNMLFRN